MIVSGYDIQRFPKIKGNIFNCSICHKIIKGPYNCKQCSSAFCKDCIYITNNGICPKRCPQNNINQITTRIFMNPYKQLIINCQYCFKQFLLQNIQKHQMQCNRPKCKNQFCKKDCSSRNQFCSQLCLLFLNVCNSKTLPQIYNFITNNKILKINTNPKPIKQNFKNQPYNNTNKITLSWNTNLKGTNISILNNNHCLLKQQSYVFRTAITTQAFLQGRHYWQIIADKQTQNQLKLGVSINNTFDVNTAFCDHKTGFAYYGLGQLRNGSNASGKAYGKKYKKNGTIGVYLNMNLGTLYFSLNGQDMGLAYQSQQLKRGPIYPAVSFLHCAGCQIKGQLQIPQIYRNL